MGRECIPPSGYMARRRVFSRRTFGLRFSTGRSRWTSWRQSAWEGMTRRARWRCKLDRRLCLGRARHCCVSSTRGSRDLGWGVRTGGKTKRRRCWLAWRGCSIPACCGTWSGWWDGRRILLHVVEGRPLILPWGLPGWRLGNSPGATRSCLRSWWSTRRWKKPSSSRFSITPIEVVTSTNFVFFYIYFCCCSYDFIRFLSHCCIWFGIAHVKFYLPLKQCGEWMNKYMSVMW